MSDRYGCDDVDLSDMPYADEDGIIHHPGMGDDPRGAERDEARGALEGDDAYDAIVGQLDLGDEDLEPDALPHMHAWVLSAEDATEVCTECGASRPLGPGTE